MTTPSALASRPTDPAPPAPRLKRPHTILGRLTRAVREQNWFAVALEVCIVIVGVVIGFQITAWGQARSDAAQEQRYLHQLRADLIETERDIRRVDSLVAPQAVAGTRLVRAFFLPQEPPADSVMAWFTAATWTLYIGPAVATEEALVATGDLTLIRDDSLRSAITAHLELVRRVLYVQDDMLARWAVQFTALTSRFNPVELYTNGMTQAPQDTSHQDLGWPFPAGPRRDRFPFDAEDFLNDQDAFNEAEVMRHVRIQLRGNRARLLRATTHLREQVDAELTL